VRRLRARAGTVVALGPHFFCRVGGASSRLVRIASGAVATVLGAASLPPTQVPALLDRATGRPGSRR